MKNILKTMLLGITLASCQPTDTKSYLKEVIANLENIETASYQIEEHHWFPGPCQMAIPFLKELKGQYSADDFELIAIESWSGSHSARTHYVKQKGINYTFLGADEKVLDDYHTGRAAPYFFLLDEKRIVRKVFFGYNENNKNYKNEIKDAIDDMLK